MVVLMPTAESLAWYVQASPEGSCSTSAGSKTMGGYPGRSRRSGPFWPTRRLQAGLLPEARRRMGKCLDWGDEGAVAGAGRDDCFLFCAGACARVITAVFASTRERDKTHRARRTMRLDE